MFKKILVPLDGSKLAECALEYAEGIARNCAATDLVLISVTEKVVGKTPSPEMKELYNMSSEGRITSGVPRSETLRTMKEEFGAGSGGQLIIDGSTGTSIILGKKEKQAYNYLNKIVKKLVAKGLPAKAEVLIGDPAEKIVTYAEKCQFDIIIMASHGRSGPGRWVLGSVAEKVFRGSCIPVLLIKAPGCFPGI